MDRGMGGLWDSSRSPMELDEHESRSSHSGQRTSQNYLSMGAGIRTDTVNVSYEAGRLNADIDMMLPPEHTNESAPRSQFRFGSVPMTGLTPSPLQQMFNGNRRSYPQVQGFPHRGKEYMTSQDGSEPLFSPNPQNMGARSAGSVSPATSHSDLRLDCGFASIDSSASLSSSPNFQLDNYSQGQDAFLQVQGAWHYRPRNLSSGSDSTDLSHTLSSYSGRDISPAPYNSRVPSQSIPQEDGMMLKSQHPTLSLSPPTDQNTASHSQWPTSLQEPAIQFNWPSQHDGSLTSSPSMLEAPSLCFSDNFGDNTGSSQSNPGPVTISPSGNVFSPDDLNLSSSNIVSDYAASEATSTATTDTYMIPSEDQYLAVPRVFQNRRQSDPHPMRPGTSLLRTLSTRSPKASKSPISRPRREWSVARAPSVKEESPVGPQINLRDLHPIAQRGRRHGPLMEDQRKEIRDKRNSRNVCIRCKSDKVKCKEPPGSAEGSGACAKCQKVNLHGNKPFVCIRAHFMEFVVSGTTNYIAQYFINHVQRDLTHRRRLPVPSTIHFNEILTTLELFENDYDIRVSQGATKLYDMDLEACHGYLESLSRMQPPSTGFHQFINLHLQKDDEWRTCVKDQKPLTNLLDVLIVWNNMPSRVTYTLVRKNTAVPGHVLDPDSRKDVRVLYAAAQLSRIISRKLELSAYFQLQQDLNSGPVCSSPLVARLARLLLSLRWRLSWWSKLGGGGAATEHLDLMEFMERVTNLCSILYFYYCWMRRLIMVDGGIGRTKTSRYADTQCEVTERFPEDESWEGFSRWMEEGKEKIDEARVKEQLEVVGLRDRI